MTTKEITETFTVVVSECVFAYSFVNLTLECWFCCCCVPVVVVVVVLCKCVFVSLTPEGEPILRL